MVFKLVFETEAPQVIVFLLFFMNRCTHVPLIIFNYFVSILFFDGSTYQTSLLVQVFNLVCTKLVGVDLLIG